MRNEEFVSLNHTALKIININLKSRLKTLSPENNIISSFRSNEY